LQTRLLRINRELEFRKRLNPLDFYEPLPQQKRWEEDDARTKGIFGGNRAGKTEEGAEYTIRKCLKKKSRWWAAAETFADSVNIQQKKIWDLLPKNRVRYGKYDEINGFTNRKLLFDNGSIIIFKSYDQGRESFQGESLDGVWFDEEPPYPIYKESLMRLIDKNGECIFTMTSLKGVTEVIQSIFEGYEIIEARHAPLVGETLPTIAQKGKSKFYFLWTTDNPYIDQERVVKEAKEMTRSEIKSRIYGLPLNLLGRVYVNFNRKIHVIPFDNVPFSKVTLYHILDPHDRKPWAMQWWAVHTTGTMYCIDEYPERDFNEMTTDPLSYTEYVKIIREKEETLHQIFRKSVHKRIIDPNFGNKTVQLAERQGGQAYTTPKRELSRRGLRFTDGIDAIEAGHLAVRQDLYWEEKGGEIVIQPKIYIVEHCKNTINHLSKYSRKENGKLIDKYKDFCDTTRYFRMSNPKYVTNKVFKPETTKIY